MDSVMDVVRNAARFEELVREINQVHYEANDERCANLTLDYGSHVNDVLVWTDSSMQRHVFTNVAEAFRFWLAEYTERIKRNHDNA